MSQQDSITNINGVDAGALGAMIEDITQKPSLGQARFRARNTWISGGQIARAWRALSVAIPVLAYI